MSCTNVPTVRHAVRHRVVKSHRLIVACRVFHSRRRWSEYRMPETVCSLESITRDGQAVRKPTRPRTTHRSTPSVPPPPPVPLGTGSCGRPSSRGSQSPEARNRQDRPGTTACASMNFVRYARTLIIETFVLPCLMYVASLGGLFFTLQILPWNIVRDRRYLGSL